MEAHPPAIRLVRDFLYDLLFPRRCVGCNRPGTLWCTDCLNAVEYVSPASCNRCGRPIRDSVTGICRTCAVMIPSLTGCFSVAYSSGPMRRAIHKLKYEGQTQLADPLASFLIRWWEQNSLSVDLIVPIPLHPRREKERGYNQAALLSRRLSNATEISHANELLRRTRDTVPQVGLKATERRKNVAGAFECVGNQVVGRSVLLIDDVTTTGATLEAAAHALRGAGAREVWGLTVARAMQQR